MAVLFFKQKTAYEMRISDWSSDVCSSDLPWVQPWGTATASIGMPYNAVSDRRYSGINILTLWNAIVTRGFATHAFLTFRKAIALGGSVRRGERGIGVIYTRRFTPREIGRASCRERLCQ